jgi:hypothetical protein
LSCLVGIFLTATIKGLPERVNEFSPAPDYRHYRANSAKPGMLLEFRFRRKSGYWRDDVG